MMKIIFISVWKSTTSLVSLKTTNEEHTLPAHNSVSLRMHCTMPPACQCQMSKHEKFKIHQLNQQSNLHLKTNICAHKHTIWLRVMHSVKQNIGSGSACCKHNCFAWCTLACKTSQMWRHHQTFALHKHQWMTHEIFTLHLCHQFDMCCSVKATIEPSWNHQKFEGEAKVAVHLCVMTLRVHTLFTNVLLMPLNSSSVPVQSQQKQILVLLLKFNEHQFGCDKLGLNLTNVWNWVCFSVHLILSHFLEFPSDQLQKQPTVCALSLNLHPVATAMLDSWWFCFCPFTKAMNCWDHTHTTHQQSMWLTVESIWIQKLAQVRQACSQKMGQTNFCQQC